MRMPQFQIRNSDSGIWVFSGHMIHFLLNQLIKSGFLSVVSIIAITAEFVNSNCIASALTHFVGLVLIVETDLRTHPIAIQTVENVSQEFVNVLHKATVAPFAPQFANPLVQMAVFVLLQMFVIVLERFIRGQLAKIVWIASFLLFKVLFWDN